MAEVKEIKGIKLEQSFQVLGFKKRSEGKNNDRVIGVITPAVLDINKQFIDIDDGVFFDSYIDLKKPVFPGKIYRGIFVVPRFSDGDVQLRLVSILD